ncbi:MAG: leucyl/phenylalanyl-tRNA--protein transferase [Candidatus Obscuribacterales bacterium]|nr:leucyl/phenylalanyl-tRNA--protein transferase [Candidatus Obscuribacterales bacterium]
MIFEREFTPALVLAAYGAGIFPMGESRGRISWHSPDPRCIIDLENFHTPKRLARTYRKGMFEMKVNHNWDAVIRKCAERKTTWITEPIIAVYTRLHEAGFAHSVEAYADGRLAGGLYGVSLGGAFFGESMFHEVTDASKISLVFLVERMRERGFTLLDSQFMTEHLSQFTAVNIPRKHYLDRLQSALPLDCRFGDEQIKTPL